MKAERRDEDGKILIDSPDEIPSFATEREYVKFWDTHTPSDSYLRNYRLGPDDPVVKRLDELLASQKSKRS